MRWTPWRTLSVLNLLQWWYERELVVLWFWIPAFPSLVPSEYTVLGGCLTPKVEHTWTLLVPGYGLWVCSGLLDRTPSPWWGILLGLLTAGCMRSRCLCTTLIPQERPRSWWGSQPQASEQSVLGPSEPLFYSSCFLALMGLGNSVVYASLCLRQRGNWPTWPSRGVQMSVLPWASGRLVFSTSFLA